jgi:hypothetical protein
MFSVRMGCRQFRNFAILAVYEPQASLLEETARELGDGRPMRLSSSPFEREPGLGFLSPPKPLHWQHVKHFAQRISILMAAVITCGKRSQLGARLHPGESRPR